MQGQRFNTQQCVHRVFPVAAADLVPDIPSLRRSLQSRFTIQVQPMASLQCAYDEGCLSSSAWRNGGPRQGILPFTNLCIYFAVLWVAIYHVNEVDNDYAAVVLNHAEHCCGLTV